MVFRCEICRRFWAPEAAAEHLVRTHTGMACRDFIGCEARVTRFDHLAALTRR